jgi:hypothetical protein
VSEASGVEIRDALPADEPILLRMMRALAEHGPGKRELYRRIGYVDHNGHLMTKWLTKKRG